MVRDRPDGFTDRSFIATSTVIRWSWSCARDHSGSRVIDLPFWYSPHLELNTFLVFTAVMENGDFDIEVGVVEWDRHKQCPEAWRDQVLRKGKFF
jgi:hypothetical protein